MSRIMVANSAANSLSILLEIPSGPTALFVANLDKSYKISFSETDSWWGMTFGGDCTGTNGSKCSVMLVKNLLISDARSSVFKMFSSKN